MTTLSKPIDTSRLTPQARKAYRRGLGEIALKLRGHHRPTASELAASELAKGLEIVRKKLSAARQVKTLASTSAPAVKSAAKTPAPAGHKTYSTPGPRTRKRYACAGLFA